MNSPRRRLITHLLTVCAAIPITFCESGIANAQLQSPDLIHAPYRLDTGLISRSISFENPTGEAGSAGTAASALGPGRKGAPKREIAPGEEVALCDIQGPGTIRHFWLTTDQDPEIERACVIRAEWDGQSNPSIECPIGDFFGCSHGKITSYQSAVHSIGPTGGRNLWLPMPFIKRARLTFANEGKTPVTLFYQIDYTLGDEHPVDVGRLHTLFRRANPTREREDFELLPQRKQRGRYLGSVIGVRNLHPERWWGEGEIKIYMDGDREKPTICGIGSEDYAGLAWGVQLAPFLYNGCSLNENNFVTMYRWPLPAPSPGNGRHGSRFSRSLGATDYRKRRTTGPALHFGTSPFRARRFRKCPTLEREQQTSGPGSRNNSTGNAARRFNTPRRGCANLS